MINLYSNHLNTGPVWYSNGRFVSSCQMVRYWNGSLKTGLKKACLWSIISGIWMGCQGMWLYHLNTGHPYCTVFRWIRNSGVQYSDGYCFSYLQWPFGCFLFPFLSFSCTGFSFSGVYRLFLPLLSLSSLSPPSQPAKQKTRPVQWSHIHSIWDDLLKNSLSTFNTFRVLTKCVLTQF